MCQTAILDIVMSVGGFTNILQNDGKMALINMITQRIAQLGVDVETVIGPLLAQAYFDGIQNADALLSQNGTDVTMSGVNKQMHLAGVEQIVADTMADMNASFRTAILTGISNIDGILEQVNQDIATGMIKGDPSGYTAQKVAQSFAQNGMTAFITSDGKKLPLDFYAQTVTRTKYRTAHTTGATNRYKESGVYHVKVDEHSPTCHVCARFQGMVIALDPDHAQGFPVAGSGDAKLPPYHPNCQHTVRPYVMEGHSQTDIANEKKKWRSFDPDKDMRSDNEKEFYKTEQGIRRKARQELKDYEKLKMTLPPEDVPKNIGAYRRMKRKNDQSWNDLQNKYKEKMGISNATGPTDPGTPKKKKGSKTGTSGPPASATSDPKTKGNTKTKAKPKTPPKAKPKAQAKAEPKEKKPDKVDKKKDVQDVQVKGPKLTDADKKAHADFDRIIDGIEFSDMKKTAQHLLDRSDRTNHLKSSVRSNIGASGMCKAVAMMKKVHITDFILEKNQLKWIPEHHQNQTTFHEFYHANMNKLPMPHATGSKYGFAGPRWTSLEETATECSGIFMTDRAGWKYKGKCPAYSNYLIENLPRMKQLDEFKDCETLDEFGAVFLKYRFDPDHATADWEFMDKRLEGIPQVKEKEYINKHYYQWIYDNKETVQKEIFDVLLQEKAGKEEQFYDHIWQQVEKGIRVSPNPWSQMAVGLAFNTIGVKLP